METLAPETGVFTAPQTPETTTREEALWGRTKSDVRRRWNAIKLMDVREALSSKEGKLVTGRKVGALALGAAGVYAGAKWGGEAVNLVSGLADTVQDNMEERLAMGQQALRGSRSVERGLEGEARTGFSALSDIVRESGVEGVSGFAAGTLLGAAAGAVVVESLGAIDPAVRQLTVDSMRERFAPAAEAANPTAAAA